MYTLEFTLRQHTPLIHFQHDQEGATLRATEVKPKLDRFIIEEFQKYWPNEANKFSNAINTLQNCIKKKEASPYKLFIEFKEEAASNISWYYFDSTKPENIESLKVDLEKQFKKSPINVIHGTTFFANRDKYKDKKWQEIKLGNIYKGNILLKIKVFEKDIYNLLEYAVPKLFIFENFGTRQNKGFGSFTTDILEKQSEVAALLKKKYKTVKKRTLHSNEVGLLLTTINNVYKQLKNNPLNKTNKALIKEYYEDDELDPIYWEKEVLARFAKTSNIKVRDNECFVRAILGLANLYDYPQMRPKNMLVVSDYENDENQKIDRFKSPILFKIIDKTIYLVCNPIPKIMKGHKFIFTNNINDKKITMTTPFYFNENEFLNKLNWENA